MRNKILLGVFVLMVFINLHELIQMVTSSNSVSPYYFGLLAGKTMVIGVFLLGSTTLFRLIGSKF